MVLVVAIPWASNLKASLASLLVVMTVLKLRSIMIVMIMIP